MTAMAIEIPNGPDRDERTIRFATSLRRSMFAYQEQSVLQWEDGGLSDDHQGNVLAGRRYLLRHAPSAAASSGSRRTMRSIPGAHAVADS